MRKVILARTRRDMSALLPITSFEMTAMWNDCDTVCVYAPRSSFPTNRPAPGELHHSQHNHPFHSGVQLWREALKRAEITTSSDCSATRSATCVRIPYGSILSPEVYSSLGYARLRHSTRGEPCLSDNGRVEYAGYL